METALWVDARTWDESEKFLTARGMPESEYLMWHFDRRNALDVVLRRFGQENTYVSVQHADHWHIVGDDFAGAWSYEPGDGMLQPIDLHQLGEVLDDPSAVDMVARGVLESRLVADGHNPYHARWAVEEGLPKLGFTWCDDSHGTSSAPDLEEYGWINMARDLAKQIEARKLDFPEKWLPSESIARLREAVPSPDGPGKDGNFWWHRVPYPLEPVPFRFISALWKAPNRSLLLDQLVAHVWEQRPASINKSHLGKVRVNATRIGEVLLGTGLSVSAKSDKSTGRMRVSLDGA